LFVQESAALLVSGVAKWTVRENERLSEPPLVALSRFTVPLLPGGQQGAQKKLSSLVFITEEKYAEGVHKTPGARRVNC
jgi:hypothetical protein